MDANENALYQHYVNEEDRGILFDKMLDELMEKIEIDYEKMKTKFNKITADYGFDYELIDFIKDEL